MCTFHISVWVSHIASTQKLPVALSYHTGWHSSRDFYFHSGSCWCSVITASIVGWQNWKRTRTFFSWVLIFKVYLGPWGERKAACRGNEIDLGKRSWHREQIPVAFSYKYTHEQSPYAREWGGTYSGSRKWADSVGLWERKAPASLSQVQSRNQLKFKLILGVDSAGLKAVEAWVLFPQRNWRRWQIESLLGSFVQADGIEMASQNFHIPGTFQEQLRHSDGLFIVPLGFL